MPDKVGAVIAAMLKTTPESLPVDNDGDIGIRSGSAMVFVRVRDNPPLVDVFSPVLTGVNANEQLYVEAVRADPPDADRPALLHRRRRCGPRCRCSAATSRPTHLMLAVQVMTGLADELDDSLHGEFGGKRFFVETDKAGGRRSRTARRPTGMYL